MSNATRLLIGAAAILGSVAYAAWHSPRVAIAAGLSWLVFGVVLLAVTGVRPSIMEWVDACLRTMGVGIGILTLSTILHVVATGPRLLHAMILLLSQLAMAVTFVLAARRLGVRPPTAIALWLLALDVPFLLILGVIQ